LVFVFQEDLRQRKLIIQVLSLLFFIVLFGVLVWFQICKKVLLLCCVVLVWVKKILFC